MRFVVRGLLLVVCCFLVDVRCSLFVVCLLVGCWFLMFVVCR